MKRIDIIVKLVLLISIISAIIGFRYQVLSEFGFEFTDSDQSIMWNGLANYSKGEFHEPRFYGQAYNSMLESLIAVPLYKLGVPAYKALPITTSILTLFPFFLISFFSFKKKSPFVALIILSIPLLLPIEYALITSLSRGFVTGIFIASFGTIALFYKEKKWGFFLLAFTGVIGYSVNANAVLISLPCLLYLFLFNRRTTSFYLFSFAGLALGLIIHLWINSFYINNPVFNLHNLSLTYSFSLLLNSFSNFDDYFNNVMPIFWKQGFIFLPVYLVISLILFWKRKIEIGLVILSIPLLIIFTTGINKVHDGTNSIFFPLSRMYLALPIIIAITLSFIKNLKFNYFYFLIPLSCFVYKTMNLDKAIIENTSYGKNHVVSIAKVQSVKDHCKRLLTICIDNNVDLVVVVNDGYYDFTTYGCSVCYESFPQTLRPSYERRTWRLLAEENIVHTNILFLDNQNMLNQKFNFVEALENQGGIYLVKDNKLKTIALIERMGIETRKYK